MWNLARVTAPDRGQTTYIYNEHNLLSRVKHADGSKWLSQKKPELTETDVIHYNTGDEEPIINRVKTVDGERNFIQNLKAEKVRTAYQWKTVLHMERG